MSQSNKLTQKQTRDLDLTKTENVQAFFAAKDSEASKNVSTPKKPANATGLSTFNKSHALFKAKSQVLEDESSTIVEGYVSSSVKRKRSNNNGPSPQGPTNVGSKTRKVIKSPKIPDIELVDDDTTIEYYQNKVIQEKMLNVKLVREIGDKLLTITTLSSTLAKVQNQCSIGIKEASELEVKPFPYQQSLKRCNMDPEHARVHHSYMSRINKMDQQSQKITSLTNTLGLVIGSCQIGLKKIAQNGGVKFDIPESNESKPIRRSTPCSTVPASQKFAKSTNQVHSPDRIVNVKVEVAIPQFRPSYDEEEWLDIKNKFVSAASNAIDQTRLDDQIRKFRSKSAKNNADLDFTTFNISQESANTQNRSSSKRSAIKTPEKTPGFEFVDYPDCYLELANSLPLKDSLSQSPIEQQSSSMRVETGSEGPETENESKK